MKRIIVIIFAALLFAACSSSDNGVDPKARAQALSEWNLMDQISQDVACSFYNDDGINVEDLYRQMTTGDNKVSSDYAEAKLELLEEKC